jgi:hypothetical protein
MTKTLFIFLCFTLLSIILLISCGGKQQMFNSVNDLVKVMQKHTPVKILGDKDGIMLAITPEYGGKVIAMSTEGLKGKNLIWPNPQIGTEGFWSGEKRDWNLGGARTWIAPESNYYLDKDNNWFVPYEMDPGNFKLISFDGNKLVCANEFKINNIKDENFFVNITRSIELLDSYPDFSTENLKYVGMKFSHELQNMSEETIGKDLGFMGLWSLIQLDPAGTMIIPIKKDPNHDNVTVRDYGPKNFNTVPPERITIGSDWIAVKIDGEYRCKLGFAPWAVTNGIAFLRYEKGKDIGTLYLKEFDVEHEGIYLDHPWEKEYDYGDAIQMYNDDGRFGGFCEIECHGPAKELAQNEVLSHTVTFSIFSGKLDLLKEIVSNRLEVNMEEVKLY